MGCWPKRQELVSGADDDRPAALVSVLHDTSADTVFGSLPKRRPQPASATEVRGREATQRKVPMPAEGRRVLDLPLTQTA